MTITILTTLIEAHVQLLQAQTNLIMAVTAANPQVSAELWKRFADDTKWIHDALVKLNGWLERVIGPAPVTPA